MGCIFQRSTAKTVKSSADISEQYLLLSREKFFEELGGTTKFRPKKPAMG